MNSSSAPARNPERWTIQGLACRFVQIILALYLIPAVLVVFLVGALGILIVETARLLLSLHGRTTS
jgi:hypothetical protein